MKIRYSLVGGVLVKSFQSTVFKQAQGVENEKRGGITEFSTKSARGMCRHLRGCFSEYTHMVTLTYPREFSRPMECKLHLRLFLARTLRHMRRIWFQQTERYRNSKPALEPSIFWFLEFQQNGSPHFHLLTNQFINYETVARNWYEIVGSGIPAHLQAGTRTERLRLGRKGIASYAKKYASKQNQKELPDMYKNQVGFGRWWGVVGDRRVVEAAICLEPSRVGSQTDKKCVKSIESVILQLERAGKLRKMNYELCECWVTDDDNAKIALNQAISEAKGEISNGREVLHQAKQIKTENLQRERRRKDYLRGSRGWREPDFHP